MEGDVRQTKRVVDDVWTAESAEAWSDAQYLATHAVELSHHCLDKHYGKCARARGFNRVRRVGRIA